MKISKKNQAFLIIAAFCAYQILFGMPLYHRAHQAYLQSGQEWSLADKENAQHFVQSMQLINQAAEIENSEQPFVEVPKEKFEKTLSLYKEALTEANLVTDVVLSKANPELPKYYRSDFQKGIELRISSRTSGKLDLETQSTALFDSWADWLDQNRTKIKIPR